MAKFQRTYHEDFDKILQKIERAVLGGSVSATLEESTDYRTPQGRCSIRIYERYSYTGKNRVSMSVTVFQAGPDVEVCAITSGGSQGMFFKVNTWGEEAFLETLANAL